MRRLGLIWIGLVNLITLLIAALLILVSHLSWAVAGDLPVDKTPVNVKINSSTPTPPVTTVAADNVIHANDDSKSDHLLLTTLVLMGVIAVRRLRAEKPGV
jgi:hypothetical protein